MKYLFLLLVLTACTTPKTETKQEAVEISSSLEAFVPKTKEDLDKLRTPVPSYEVLSRLVRVESSTSFRSYEQNGSIAGTTRYRAIYLDPIKIDYYFGKIDITNYASDFVNSLNYKNITNYSLDTEDRLIVISNLSPSERVILDAGYFPQHTNLFLQVIRKTPDPYYWWDVSYDGDFRAQEIRNINELWLEQADLGSLGNDSSLTNAMVYLPYTNYSVAWPQYYLVHTNSDTPSPNRRLQILRSLDTGDIRGFSWEFPTD